MVKIGLVSVGDPLFKLVFKSRYAAAVRRAGGVPVWLPWNTDPQRHKFWAQQLDGFLFTGGGDPDPAYYGQAMLPACGTPVPARDLMELGLLRQVLATGKPILGICRGEQMLNVAMGGTLVQDIPTQRPAAAAENHGDSAHRFAPSHPAQLLPGTRLRQMLGADSILTNSIHHQAVDLPAPGLRIAAQSPAGIVEAVEGTGPEFRMGLQWHPEATADRDPLMQQFFDELVRAAAQ